METPVPSTIFFGRRTVFKGTAGFFALKNIVSLAHAMESLLEEIRSGHLVIDRRMIDTLLAANDSLKAMPGDVEASDWVDISGHLARIAGFKSAEAPAVWPATNPGRSAPAAGDKGKKGAVTDDMLKVIREAAGRGYNVYRVPLITGMEAAADNGPPPRGWSRK